MKQWIAGVLRAGPEMSPIAVVATGVTSGTVAIFGGLLVRHGVDAGAVLGFFGGIGGAAIGAWVAVGGALSVERWKIAQAKSVQRVLLRGALAAIGDTVVELRDGVHASDPGTAVSLAKINGLRLESRRDDLATIRRSLPIDSFAIFEALQSFGSQIALFKDAVDDCVAGFDEGVPDVAKSLVAFQDIVDRLATKVEGAIASVNRALETD